MEGRLVILLGLMLFAVSAPAEIQKWVDENGQTHYGERPPEGTRSQRIDTSGANVIETSPNQGRIRQMNQEFDARRALKEERQAEAQKEAQEAQKRCRHAKGQLNIMQQKVPVFYADGDKRQYVDDQERKATIQSLKEKVARYCR